MVEIKKLVFVKGLLIMVVALLALTSCKKKRAFNEEDAQITVDVRITQGECDEVIKDVNTVIMEQYLLRGRSSEAGQTGTTSVCGAVLDTSLLTKGIVTILYTGTDCYGKTRSGNVKFSILDHPLKKWKHQGCTVKIEFKAFKVVRSSDGKTIELDGTQYMVNESGNTWYELWYLNAPQVNYNVTGDDFKVVFQGLDVLKMNFNRRLTFTYSNYVTSCLVEGKGSSDGKTRLESWGTDRQAVNFTTEVSRPYTWKTNCGAIAPVSGEVTVRVAGKAHDLKCAFATDKDGNDVSGSDSPCPFGYKVSWNYKKKTNTRLFSYY